MNRSFIAEIIGPAGSGKTSLMALLRNNDNVRSGLSVWRLPLTLLVVSAVSSLPGVVAFCARRRRLSWEDVKLFIQSHALLRLIENESTKGYRALLIDEGSVFALAKLRAFAAPSGAGGNEHWMLSLINQTTPRLNAIIWLDAPDDVLAHRIRHREKPHRVKDLSDTEIENHLSCYRNSFEQVVSELGKRNGMKIFRYSTDQMPLEQIAANVMSEAGAL